MYGLKYPKNSTMSFIVRITTIDFNYIFTVFTIVY